MRRLGRQWTTPLLELRTALFAGQYRSWRVWMVVAMAIPMLANLGSWNTGVQVPVSAALAANGLSIILGLAFCLLFLDSQAPSRQSGASRILLGRKFDEEQFMLLRQVAIGACAFMIAAILYLVLTAVAFAVWGMPVAGPQRG